MFDSPTNSYCTQEVFDTEEESAVLASLANLRTMREEDECIESTERADDIVPDTDDAADDEAGDTLDAELSDRSRLPSDGTAREGDIEDETTTEDNDDSGKLLKLFRCTNCLQIVIVGISVTPKLKRKRRRSSYAPRKRKESFRRSKYYLMPDPDKIEDLPQNTYSKRVMKVQFTRVTETAIAEITDYNDDM